MIEWAHEVHRVGEDNARPMPRAEETPGKDAHAVVEYLTMFLKIIYDLPHQITARRAEKSRQRYREWPQLRRRSNDNLCFSF